MTVKKSRNPMNAKYIDGRPGVGGANLKKLIFYLDDPMTKKLTTCWRSNLKTGISIWLDELDEVS